MIECPKCGVENPDDVTYCKECGEALAPEEVVTLKPTPPTVAPSVTKPVPSVRVIKPITPRARPLAIPTPTRVPSLGACFYHASLLATYICGRCGRGICRDCAKPHGDMIFCPECYAKSVPPTVPMPLPPPKTNWALVALAISIVAVGILIALVFFFK